MSIMWVHISMQTSDYWESLALTGPRLIISANKMSYTCNQGWIQDFLLGGGVYHISSNRYTIIYYAILLERGGTLLKGRNYTVPPKSGCARPITNLILWKGSEDIMWILARQ